MAQNNVKFSTLYASSMEELLSHEAEILKRINAMPNGGRLLLLDPQRLMQDIQVELTPDALEEWRSTYPDFFAPTGREHAYNAVAQSRPEDEISIAVEGLFQRGRT